MAKLTIHSKNRQSKISKEIYGHFSEHLGRCIYGGIFVGEDSPIENVNGMRKDVVEALKEIQVPVLRWPGGCFADEYHWQDGIGPRGSRKKMINTNWGGVVEDNSFGTHEYFELCRQLGCESYINGNVGSGTVREMAEWIEYMTFKGTSPLSQQRRENGHEEPWKVDFFGVGNENWGCGGNMTPEYYANEFRRYQTYIKNYHQASEGEDFRPIQKICCGPSVDDYEWTRKVLEICYRNPGQNQHGFMDGLSLHHYVVPQTWEHKGSATDFDEAEFYMSMSKAVFMQELIEKHSAIMDEFDPEKKIALVVDEWGIWCDVEPGTNPGFLYQQNTVRDAVIAGLTLNIFNKHSDRVRMANIAQTVNVLQSVILTEGEKMIKTPTHHVFNMYKYHQDAQLVESRIETKEIGVEKDYMVPNLTESVSIAKDGRMHITVTNLSATDAEKIEAVLDCRIAKVSGQIVSGDMHAKNTFEEPDQVQIRALDGIETTEQGFAFQIPACSVVHLTAELA